MPLGVGPVHVAVVRHSRATGRPLGAVPRAPLAPVPHASLRADTAGCPIDAPFSTRATDAKGGRARAPREAVRGRLATAPAAVAIPARVAGASEASRWLVRPRRDETRAAVKGVGAPLGRTGLLGATRRLQVGPFLPPISRAEAASTASGQAAPTLAARALGQTLDARASVRDGPRQGAAVLVSVGVMQLLARPLLVARATSGPRVGAAGVEVVSGVPPLLPTEAATREPGDDEGP